MMGGMLVPVESIRTQGVDEPVDKAAVAIQTLFGVDPEFVELCKTLYGDSVDPVDVWLDVFKMEPTGPDMMTHAGQANARRRQRRGAKVFKSDLDTKQQHRRAGVAVASGVGAVAGGLGFARGAQGARAARAAGKAIPKLDKALLAVEPIGLTGEVGATHFLGNDARKKRGVAVEKVAVPGVHAMAQGYETAMRSTLPTATRPGGAAAKMKPRSVQPVSSLKDKNSSIAKAEPVDVIWAGEFSKFDDDKRLVFGWASVVELNGMPIVDRQGDYIHPDDLENASYEYVMKSRVGGDMHRRAAGDVPFKVSDMVESMVFTPEKIEKMGLPPEAAEKIPTGWWMGFKVHDDQAWDEVKKGDKAGFSIHGRGQRVPTDMDRLVPGYA